MNVLMISLGNEFIISPKGQTVDRHMEYARAINGEIHIISLIKGKHKYSPVSYKDKVFVHPICSNNIIFLMMKAMVFSIFILKNKKYDVMYCQDPFGTAIVGLLIKNIYKIPLIIGNHSSFVDNKKWIAERKFFFTILNWILKKTIPRANALRVINFDERNHYEEIIGINKKYVAVIHTPVLLDNFLKKIPLIQINKLKNQLKIPDDSNVFIWVGRPVKVKRLSVLLKAFSYLLEKKPNSKLLLVGNFDLQQEDLDKVQQDLNLGDDSVIKIMDGVTYLELPLYYQCADIYVHSSNYEGFGKVLIEAAASGLPVISTNTAGARIAINDGVTGVLVPIDNPKALYQAMLSMLTKKNSISEMSKNGKQRVIKEFGQDINITRMVSMWKKVANSNIKDYAEVADDIN